MIPTLFKAVSCLSCYGGLTAFESSKNTDCNNMFENSRNRPLYLRIMRVRHCHCPDAVPLRAWNQHSPCESTASRASIAALYAMQPLTSRTSLKFG